MRKPYLQAAAFSLLNACLMLALALYWLGLPRTFGDEALFIRWTSLVKKSLLGIDQKPPYESVLYVDISGSKMLVEEKDPFYEEYTGYQKKAITSRAQLASFLRYIADYGSQIPIVILDLTLSVPSPDDSLLQATLYNFPFPIVGAQKLLENGQLEENLIQLETGVASYLSADGIFMKYPLFVNDSMPTLPLEVLHQAEGRPYTWDRLWPEIGHRPSLINPIIDFKIRLVDLNDGSSADKNTFPIRSLGTLLYEWEFWEEEDIRQMLKQKTIVVGDFKDDNHETAFGSFPGPLLVHNAYLTLAAGESLIKLPWLLLLFGLFFWMSWRVFFQERSRKPAQKTKGGRTAIGNIITDSIDDTFFLVCGTILSYFIFNIHINILILLIHLKIATYLLKRLIFRQHRLKQQS